MSGSYYALNSKINNLQAEIVSLQATGGANTVTTNTAQTITGLKTFSTLPVSSVVPTTGNQLVNKTYADSLSPPTSTLSAVLTAGNSATNSIALNNTGVGTNVISLLPNATANNPHIELTDGTTTNVITKNGITTRNSVQNSTHYLNFSDTSTTGTGAIQKTAGITCNPSTNTVSASTFVGTFNGTASTATNANNVAIAEDNTASTFYPTFVSDNTGNLPLKVDKTTTPLSYVPSTGTLTASVFSGSFSGTATTANNANNVAISDDDTASTFYPVFVSNNTGNLPLKVDKTTTPLTYVPSTGVLTTQGISLTNNITLGPGTTLPGSTQLGFTTSPALSTTGYPTTIANGIKTYYSFTLPAGTWSIAFRATIVPTTNTAVNGYLELFLGTSQDQFTPKIGTSVVSSLFPGGAFQSFTILVNYTNASSQTVLLNISAVNLTTAAAMPFNAPNTGVIITRIS